MFDNRKRIAFLTPDENTGGIEICRPLILPLNFLPLFAGALAPLTEPRNWEQFGTLTPDQSAEICTQLILDWYSGVCDAMACCPLRFNPNSGMLEQYDPETDTWDEIPFGPSLPDGGTITYPDPTPQNPLQDDTLQRCTAAANAAIVTQQLYQETWDVLVSGTAGVVFGLISLLSGFVDSILGGRGAITAITQFARDIYEQGDEFTVGGFPDTALEDVQNIFFCRSSVVDDVVTFDHEGARLDFVNMGLVQPYLGLVVLMTTFFNQDALNVAGGVSVATDVDCSEADCDDTWCYEFDFTGGDTHGWTFTNNSAGVPFGSGAVGGIMYADLRDPAATGSAFRRIVMNRAFPVVPDSLTHFSVDYDYVFGGDGTSGTVFLRTLVNGGVVQQFTRGDIIGGLITIPQEWDGEVLTPASMTLDWSARIDSSSPFNYSGNIRIKSILLSGNGPNPFGSDNC